MIRIRGASGIGDAIYLRAVVDHFIRKGERVTVCNDHKDVFLGLDCTVEPFRRDKVDKHAVYTTRKKFPGTNQWQDVCIQAGIPYEPLTITWTCRNAELIDNLRRRAEGRALVLVHGGRTPMGRKDGFGKELLPEQRAFAAVLNGFRDCFMVRIGHGPEYPLPVHADLNGKTTIADMLDLGQACDAVVGQCSLAIPLAEGFGKPAMFVWAAAGLKAPSDYIRQIRPEKILSSPRSAFVMDDWTDAQIQEEVNAFRLCL